MKPCEEIRNKVGVLMFEFTRFRTSDYEHGRDFVSDLDKSLGKLPSGWPYAIELRNEHWLQPDYFACLARQKVAHVFNSWAAMPPVGEKMALPGSRTNPNLCAARFLLTTGRKYEEAVSTFKPYTKIKEIDGEARIAARGLIADAITAGPKQKTIIYVNNRLEGNAIETISTMLEVPN